MPEKAKPLQIKISEEKDIEIVKNAQKKLSKKLFGNEDKLKLTDLVLWMINELKETFNESKNRRHSSHN